MALVAKDAAAYTMPADKLMSMSNRELCDKGRTHWNNNQLDSALICYSIVSNRNDDKQSRDDFRLVSGATTAMAIIYKESFYDYERAMQFLLKAEQIAMKHDIPGQLSYIYLAMASLEQSKHDIEQNFTYCATGLELFKKAFRLALDNKVESVITTSLTNMITHTLSQGKLDMITQELNQYQGLMIGDSIPERDFTKHQCLGAILTSQGRYDDALRELSHLDETLDKVEGHTKNILRIIAHENRYYVLRDSKNPAAALLELDMMDKIALEHGIKEGHLEVLLYKRNYYAEQGNTTVANDYDLQYHKAKEQLMTEAKVAKADEEKVLFKLNEANHEIKELYYKQHIQQTELIAVAVVAVLLLALLVLAWLSHRRTKQKNQSLYDRNQQLLTHVDRLRQIRKEQEQKAQETQTISTTTIKYGRGKMEHNDIAQVMEKVERAMDTSPEIFSTDFSLDQLVELTGESRPRLSQALNEVPDRSFYSILNEYRVREACRRMNDKEHYSDLTIEAVGQSVGFKSRSNFVSTFKRIIGLTPSAYLKQVDSSTAQHSSNDSSDTY